MSFIKELLNYISEVGVLVPGIEFPNDYLRRIKRSTYYGTLRRLEKKELVVKKKKGKTFVYEISDKGKNILAQRIAIKKRKDGFSTLVIFDIPEEKKSSRQAFRRYLIRNGFKVLQKSVYISRNIVPKTIIEVTKELDIHSNVSVIGGRIEYFL